jgi:hypothetical protein
MRAMKEGGEELPTGWTNKMYGKGIRERGD